MSEAASSSTGDSRLSKKKGTGTELIGGLPSPGTTPAVEDGRAEADRNRRALEQANDDADPPDRVKTIYDIATIHFEYLKPNPEDDSISNLIVALNERISQENEDEGKSRGKWNIDVEAITQKYKLAVQVGERLKQEPDDANAAEEFMEIKEDLDEIIQKANYPKAWSIAASAWDSNNSSAGNEDVAEVIERILECHEFDYYGILGIGDDAEQALVSSTWRDLGCLIHPDYAKHKDAATAFNKLKKTVEDLELSSLDIKKVVEWDGSTDLSGYNPPESSDVLPPPERVKKIYKEAGAVIDAFRTDPTDGVIENKLKEFNAMIKQGNDKESMKDPNSWTIPIEFFKPHYSLSFNNFLILRRNPKDEKVLAELRQLRDLIGIQIRKSHLPEDWNILTAEEFLQSEDSHKDNEKERTSKLDAAEQAIKDAERMYRIVNFCLGSFVNKTVADSVAAEFTQTKDEAMAAKTKVNEALENAKVALEKARASGQVDDAVAAYDAANTASSTASDGEGVATDAANKARSLVKKGSIFEKVSEAKMLISVTRVLVQNLDSHLRDLDEQRRGKTLSDEDNLRLDEIKLAIKSRIDAATVHVGFAEVACENAATAASTEEATHAITELRSELGEVIKLQELIEKESATAGLIISAAQARPPAEVRPSVEGAIKYEWPTFEMSDGLIIGVRKRGRNGHQVLVEAEEDGRLVRRLESATEVGLWSVGKYLEGPHKNLALNQGNYSYKDRRNFEEVLWCTRSQTKSKNVAARNRDPDADCLVRFRGSLDILSVTSLCRVIGNADAWGWIEKVCKRDGFEPPWGAGYVSHYHDEAKVTKGKENRRRARDAQAKANPPERFRNHYSEHAHSSDRRTLPSRRRNPSSDDRSSRSRDRRSPGLDLESREYSRHSDLESRSSRQEELEETVETLTAEVSELKNMFRDAFQDMKELKDMMRGVSRASSSRP